MENPNLRFTHFSKVVLVCFAVEVCILALFPAKALANESCEDPGRNTTLCYRMKNLRAGLGLMDEQRDLMQTNYSLLESVAQEMGHVVNRILVEGGVDAHLSPLTEVRGQILEVISQAQAKRLEAFQAANTIRTRCLACHSETAPMSGHTWSEISKLNWDWIVPRCNSPGRLSYTCKSMFGMLTSLQYIQASAKSGSRSFEAAAEAARELTRIAADAKSKGAVHAGALSLSVVESQGQEIVLLATQRNPQAFERTRQLTLSCKKCHAPDEGGDPW